MTKAEWLMTTPVNRQAHLNALLSEIVTLRKLLKVNIRSGADVVELQKSAVTAENRVLELLSWEKENQAI